jgi:hypothetical protein
LFDILSYLERKSQGIAMLARRKMGKTAIMERLFNITFAKNDGVIPFYYEIKEVKKWVGDFIGEVKSREVKKFAEVKKLENIDRAVGFIFSRGGFTKDAEDYCQEKGIAYREDERWLESGKSK